MTVVFRRNVARMEGYVPGEQPREHDFIKLNTNENPYPPSPSVRKAILRELITTATRIVGDCFGEKDPTQLLDDAQSWLVCALILLVAVLGKFGGAALAARFTGHSWRTSCTLGALMNTRGLIELIMLNIGYDLGILSPKIFTMMIIMAVATTMMTGPILRLMKPASDP